VQPTEELRMTETTTPIAIAYPEADSLSLRVSVGACTLTITSGAGPEWVEGTYRDPSGKIPLVIDQGTGAVRIRQSPDVESVVGLFQGAPRLDLRLGTDRPFDLLVEGGANEVDLSLGGVPLTQFELKHGAGKVEIGFESPNPAEMKTLRLATGAGLLEAEGLANANFAELIAEGGAAKFELQFGGKLRRAGSVRISTGAAGVEIDVPADVPARVAAKTTLGSIAVGSGFTTHDGGYWNAAAEAGGEPALTMDVTVAVGSLRISTG
jgi:hypothetical protein